MSEGFYKRRRGIVEHLEGGKINLIDLAVHDYLNLKANLLIGSGSSIPPGICITSAAAIHAVCPGQISERAIQRSLEHLQRIGWIKRWNVRGKRGNYPVLVCRGSVHDLSGKEYRINGEDTTDWRDPKWTAVDELSPLREVTDTTVSGDRELRIEKSKPSAAKTAAAADPRFQPIIDSYYEGNRKSGIEPSCDKSDFGALRSWLKKNAARTVESVLASLSNVFNSTDQYPLRAGFRLREFLEHESKYQLGPLARNVRPLQVQTPTPILPRSQQANEEAKRKLQKYGVKGVAC